MPGITFPALSRIELYGERGGGQMSRPIIMRAGVMAGAAILLMTALTPPVHARVATAEGSAAACSMDVGSVTAAGDHTYRRVTAGTPPTIAAVP
jgi:hypothetical protein